MSNVIHPETTKPSKTSNIKAPHIIFRKDHPYFMIRVPADLVDKFNKKFIRKSLKTQNPAEAKTLAEIVTHGQQDMVPYGHLLGHILMIFK